MSGNERNGAMSRKVTVLGSTGSIGRQSLEVIAACGMEAVALAANSSAERMEEQARRYRPVIAALADERAAADLRVRLADTNVHVLSGLEGVLEAAALPSADTAIAALVGMAGLRPTLASIREGKRVCLANKEALVCAGPLVLEEAKDYGAKICPVDSEHSALFQCLEANRDRGEVKRLILTCSGGPFYGKKREENNIFINLHRPLISPGTIRTNVHPGFPTDAQPPLMALTTMASGTTVFVENIFENRFKHASELTRLGAKISVEGKVAVVSGVKGLSGAELVATDLRGGASLITAGLAAEGTSKISGICHVDRGYESIEKVLRSVGADIRRI